MVTGNVTISASPTSGKPGDVITFTGRALIDGAPIPGLHIGIYLDAAPAPPVFLTSGENDANGYYNIQWTSNLLGNLPIYALAAAYQGFKSPTITVIIREETEPGWEYDSTYRGIEIQVWMPAGTPFTAYFDGSWHTAALRSTLQNEIDDFLEPEIEGRIHIVYYWIEGMAGWENLEAYTTPANVGDDIHLGVGWLNDGSSAAVGHVIAQIKSPAGSPYLPDAVANQDRSAEPGSGSVVQFASVTLNEGGVWEFYAQLTFAGTVVDTKQFTFGVQGAPVGTPTTITISAPSKAAVDEKFFVSGILYETESGIPIPSQPINHSYNGRSLGSSTTGVDGDYMKEVSIPEAGTWTIKSEFPGTEALQTSRALVDAVVGEISIETPLLIAGSIVTGLALVTYGLM